MAAYLIRGRLQAALVAAVAAIVALLFAPFGLLSAAVIALITLRKGAGEGALLTGITAFGTGGLAWLVVGTPMPVVGFLALFWLPTLGLALVLRSSVSLALTLEAGLGLAVAAVVLLYAWLGEPAALWREVLDLTLRPLLLEADLGLESARLSELLAEVSQLMTAALAITVFYTLITGLFVGRWWQALLFNPGGFRAEFEALRLSRVLLMIGVAAAVGALALPPGVAHDLALLVVSLFCLQGLAMLHSLVTMKRLGRGWLVAVYAALAILPVQLAFAIAVIGLADGFLDVRKRLAVNGRAV